MVPTHFLSVVWLKIRNEKRVWLTPARRCRQNEEKTQLCKSLSPDCRPMRMLLNLNGTEQCSSSSCQNVLLLRPRCHTQSWVRHSCAGSTWSVSVCCVYLWSVKGLKASSFYMESVIIFITTTHHHHRNLSCKQTRNLIRFVACTICSGDKYQDYTDIQLTIN